MEIYIVLDTNVFYQNNGVIEILKAISDLDPSVKVVVPSAVFEQIELSYLKLGREEEREILDKDHKIFKIRNAILRTYPVLLGMIQSQKWLILGSRGTGIFPKLMTIPAYQKLAQMDKGDVRIMATIFALKNKIRKTLSQAKVILFTYDQGLQKLAYSRHIPVICDLRIDDKTIKGKKVKWTWKKRKHRLEVERETRPINAI